MTQHFNAKLHFVGGHIAFDDVMGGHLQVHADNIGMDRLLADMPVDQYCRVDPTSTELRRVRASAQGGMAYKQTSSTTSRVVLARSSVLSSGFSVQCRVCMQHLGGHRHSA